MPWRPLVAGLALLVVALMGPASAQVEHETRYAVVVGNAAYQHQPLANPINDARAVSGALRELGFEVVLLEDVTRADLERVVERLPELVRPRSVGLFYYAGHAVQYRGANYLLPVDFAIQEPEDLPEAAVELADILGTMEKIGVGISLVVLDACRDYPFGPLREVFGEGLAGVVTKGETLVAYATAAGQTALDGTGPNSPYTSALIAALELPGRDLYDIFRTVRAKVREATGGQQIPWISGSLETRLVLRGQDLAPETARVASAEAEPIEGVVRASYDLAATHWTSIAHSADPADFERFIHTHPQSPLARLAASRHEELVQAGEQPIAPLQVAALSVPGPGDRSVVVTPCDRWASDPYDPGRIAPGVPWGLVNTRQAIRDCAAAVAAEPDSARLNFLLARALDVAERFGEAEAYYRAAAERGYGAAMRSLGFMYRNGRGVPADDTVAAGFYLDASLEGVQIARAALAKMYEEGWGVPRSLPEAIRLLELAAEDGFATAIDQLAIHHRDGKGVAKDPARAAELHRLAAALGHSNAMSNLARLYRDGEGVAKDPAEAARWYWRATEEGNPFAPYHLSQLYLKGDGGLKRDPARARALLQLSVDRGFEWALWRLAEFHESGRDGSPDPAEAAFYYVLSRKAGEAIRHPSGDKLAAEAAKKLEALAAELPQGALDAASARADEWIAQNGVFQFSLNHSY